MARLLQKVVSVACGALLFAGCRERRPEPVEPQPSASARASALLPAASASVGTSAHSPAEPTDPVLVSALEAWNRATNAADGAELGKLYAANLSLYGRIVSRADAVKRKRSYVAEHTGFAQSVTAPAWEARGDDRIVRFRKTTTLGDATSPAVDAYLVWRKDKDGFRIIDEGDVQSARKLEAKLEAQRANWRERTYDCPFCNDPEFGDDPPTARAPLGPDTVKASGLVPPGAPAVVEYGRATFNRFASAVDVPLFLKATPQSTNGDGRWFYYDAPDAVARPDREPEHLLYCAIGGFFAYAGPPANAKPDPGHEGEPKILFATHFERRGSELYYDRYIYGADGVENFDYSHLLARVRSLFLRDRAAHGTLDASAQRRTSRAGTAPIAALRSIRPLSDCPLGWRHEHVGVPGVHGLGHWLFGVPPRRQQKARPEFAGSARSAEALGSSCHGALSRGRG
ncbi:MAG TPA: nuclear transport factor 2 family protein [Polyangiaceae bacterium]|nr:nuclear transport factor 2 family protein [Polyangiaceae bacterium]